MGRCYWGNHRRRSDWSCSGRINWRSRGSRRRRLNRRNRSGESSCGLRPATPRWLSIRALGRDARFLLQSLHGTGITFEEFHPAGLRATSILAGFSANRNWSLKIGISVLAPEVHPPTLVLHQSSLTIPATDDDSFPQAICVSHQTPYVSRCSARLGRDRANHLDS